jgi:hypothetical protein
MYEKNEQQVAQIIQELFNNSDDIKLSVANLKIELRLLHGAPESQVIAILRNYKDAKLIEVFGNWKEVRYIGEKKHI